MSAQEKRLSINLSGDEALVVFDFFSRNEKKLDALQSGSEAIALAAILCPLEKHLVAPFDVDYELIVEQARKRLLDEDEK